MGLLWLGSVAGGVLAARSAAAVRLVVGVAVPLVVGLVVGPGPSPLRLVAVLCSVCLMALITSLCAMP